MKYLIQLTIPTYVWANVEVDVANEREARAAAISAVNSGTVDFEHANYSTDEVEIASVEEMK
jgi:hypothetical protein